MMNLPLNIDFSGKVVVVTGAGGLICGAMARAFAQSGAKVAALDLNEEAVKKLAAELKAEGYICEGYKANVLESAALEESGLKFVFDLNITSAFLVTQVFAEDMVKTGGNIINISSMNAYRPLTKIPAYSAAKAGISNFTQWLATHFAGTGIRCNAIAPGFLVSAQNKALLFNEDGTPTARSAKILNGTPCKRFVDAEELLGATLFLCDDKSASAITGVVLPIDCGFAAYSGV